VSRPLQHWRGYFFAGALVLQLAACAGRQEKELPAPEAEPGDGPPSSSIQASDVLDAQPADEPLSPYGNKSPYEVFGKKYYVLESSDNYVQRGTASWYGTKFHGRKTSSGEPYDMRLATAAHKTLPLPTYAEVTNLDNGRKVVVKINDRGPFKDGRLIDLSYGAALRLDMIGTGTARVEVRVIDTDGLKFAAKEPDRVAETWLQIGAYGERDGAEALAKRLTKAKLKPVSIQDSQSVFRVWLGPYVSNNEINSVIERAIELGFERPYKVSR
jgi:rare lipoprotein A